MNGSNVSSSFSSNVPSIHIEEAEDSLPLPPQALLSFDNSDMFSADMCAFGSFTPDDLNIYPCPQSLQPEYIPSTPFLNSSSELEEITEFAHLPFLTGHGLSLPHPTIMKEDGTTTSPARGLSPSSPLLSPTPSFGSSLSPLSFYEPLSDSDSLSPSPATPDQQFPWPPQGLNNHSNESLVLHPSLTGSFSDASIISSAPLGHRRSKSSPSSRREPVASKAMLEANSRRRRHPAQFHCEECNQTFTALFSLRRHQQSHTGERPFVCSIPGCEQRFYNSSDCKRHEKSRKRHKESMMQ